MGTEVLRPQDFWTDRFRLPPLAFYRRKTHHPSRNDSGNTRHHRKLSLPRPERPEHRRKSPSPSPSPSPPLSPQPHQPELPLIPKFPRRSASADELRTHLNKLAAPPQVSIRVRIPKGGPSLDTIDATRIQRDINSEATNGLINKEYLYDDDVYAGSAFFASPSPSSLPLPSFFNHNNNNSVSSINAAAKTDEFHHHDLATRDLRRLLRLE